jgi:hypothetical protein
VSFQGLVKDAERFIEEIGCAAHGHMNLLESLFPPAFLVERLKASMMFIQDRLFRIEYETIDGCHGPPVRVIRGAP